MILNATVILWRFEAFDARHGTVLQRSLDRRAVGIGGQRREIRDVEGDVEEHSKGIGQAHSLTDRDRVRIERPSQPTWTQAQAEGFRAFPAGVFGSNSTVLVTNPEMERYIPRRRAVP